MSARDGFVNRLLLGVTGAGMGFRATADEGTTERSYTLTVIAQGRPEEELVVQKGLVGR